MSKNKNKTRHFLWINKNLQFCNYKGAGVNEPPEAFSVIFTHLFICTDRFLSFPTATVLYHVEKLKIALLFLIVIGIKCVVKCLYTDRRRGLSLVRTNLTSKWAACGPWCKRSLTSLLYLIEPFLRFIVLILKKNTSKCINNRYL